MTSALSSTESRALSLLGAGCTPVAVAAACGISESRISQFLSDESFARSVAELRFKNLQQYNDRDSAYDDLEDKLLEKMRDVLPLMIRPMEIIRALTLINAAKRRGAQSVDSTPLQQQVVRLTIPVSIRNTHIAVTNVNNQVVQAGEQSLVTIQPSALLSSLKRDKDKDKQNDGTSTLERISS